MLRASALLSLVVLSACEGGVTHVDARFSTPEHTMGSLLRAYDLEDVPQSEIRERMASRGRFELEDRDLYEQCFADFDGTAAEEGYAGFVVGALAAGRDDVRVTITGDRAELSPREGVRIVMHRAEDGTWGIVLAESVPDDLRERLSSVAEHAEGRLRRGIPSAEP
jgi:hypothetical protein